MSRSCRTAGFIAVVCTLIGGQNPTDQPSRTELSKLGKPATAFVQILSEGRPIAAGSAFCVHPKGYFVTNEHVVELATKPNAQIRLVLNPTEKHQRLLTARVVRVSKDPDLALLRADTSDRLPTLTIGNAEDLTELQELVAFGFPFGDALAVRKGEYPAMSINAGSLTSIRKRDGDVTLIQTDIALNPGNSGGPVLDRTGKVIGVVVAGVRGSGVNFVIPVNQLSKFLERPELRLIPVKLSRPTLHQATLFQLEAVSPLPSAGELKAELCLRTEDGPERRFPMSMKGEAFQVNAAALPEPAGQRRLRVEAVFRDGFVKGAADDREFKLDGKALWLHDVVRLKNAPEPQVILADGQRRSGVSNGLEAVPIRLGKQEIRINFTQAIEVGVIPPPNHEVVYVTAIVTVGGKEVARLEEKVPVNQP